MSQPRLAVVLLVLAVLPALGRSQPPPPPLPPQGPAPLLFVRFDGLPGMRVTFYQGQARPREFATPVVVGLRPGYVHRVKLSNLPDRPGVTLYPTLEVRGTLCLPPRMQPRDYPALFPVGEAEVRRVLGGTLVTKVVYLEHPDKSFPEPPGQVPETEVPRNQDPMQEAWDFGRPMYALRMGERELTDQELMAQTIPNTILFPGERSLGPPPVPPCLPRAPQPFYDPILGPRFPDEECLPDGGDSGPKAGFDRNGQLHGLNPSDSVAEYTDSQGRRRIACSNRVCVCVPRFAVLRQELPLAGYESAMGPAGRGGVLTQVQYEARTPLVLAHKYEQPQALRGRMRASGAVSRIGPGELERVEVLVANVIEVGPAELLGTARVLQLEKVQQLALLRQIAFAKEFSEKTGMGAAVGSTGPAVVGNVQGLRVESGVAEVQDITVCCGHLAQALGKPLCLYKWANTHAAKVGDVITFYLKYSNTGGQPITDVAVSDSLVGRLEYVPGSARADRTAVFTVQENEAGSRILRWEIAGRLLPGQSGVVSFQARVR